MVGGRGVPVGTGVLVGRVTWATTMARVGTGEDVADGAGLALCARATVRAVTRSINPMTDRPMSR
jgi:hypothetical protein